MKAPVRLVVCVLVSVGCSSSVDRQITTSQPASAKISWQSGLPASYLVALSQDREKSGTPVPITSTPDGRIGLKTSSRVIPLMPLSTLGPGTHDGPMPQIPDPNVSRFEDYIHGFAIDRYMSDSRKAFSAPPSRVENKVTRIPRDQGTRETCVAFATVAALEARPFVDANGVTGIVPDDLSEEYAYHRFVTENQSDCCKDPGANIVDAGFVLRKTGVPVESAWPYGNTDRPRCRANVECGEPPNHDHMNLDVLPRYRPSEMYVLSGNPREIFSTRNTAYLEAVIAAGYDVAIAIGVEGLVTANGIVDVIPPLPGSDLAPPRGVHAVLLTGYDRSGQYFIARDSLADGPWAVHSGDSWISYDYIRGYADYGLVFKQVTVMR
jgi:C1A family cysteine protease